MDEIVRFPEEKLCKELTDSIFNYGEVTWVKNIFVNTNYTSNPNVFSGENGRLNQAYRYKANEYKTCLKQGDFEEIMFLIEGPWKIKWVYENKELILAKLGPKGFYEIVADAYTDIENACQFKNETLELFYFGNHPQLMMVDDDLTEYQKLPNEFKVYRGVCLKKSNKEYDFLGCSWTLNFETAKWFSERRGFDSESYPLVFGLNIRKEDVLSYFSQREEEEILIDHTKIDVLKIDLIYPGLTP
jgi:hypothetical protein